MDARATVIPFLDDVATALTEADLVIMRAGASSIAELCAVGRPGLLVPYPHAAADHQRKNAESLAGRRSAIRVLEEEATPERLAAEALALARNPDERRRLARAASALGSPDAASIVARDLLTVAKIEPRVPLPDRPSSSGGARSARWAQAREVERV
jgi:UDP-N-acetylglucosamine--N-acetylmuramyl-(pentapeptide) pyrophosphoryl-undecaprenol N-acetylglucosamine transferase